MKVLGGGMLKVDSNKKRMTISGTSMAYGPADRNLVQKILKASYTDWSIRIDDS